MLDRGIKNADANALACSLLASYWPTVTMHTRCPSSCAVSYRLRSAVLAQFRKMNGVPSFHIENASTSSASTASEKMRTPFDSNRCTILLMGKLTDAPIMADCFCRRLWDVSWRRIARPRMEARIALRATQFKCSASVPWLNAMSRW